MILQTVVLGPMQVNCYIVAAKESAQAVVIDPGAQERLIQKVLEKHSLKVGMVINTHGHYDHIGADDYCHAPVYVHTLDKPMLTDPKLNLSALFSISYTVSSPIHELKEGDTVGVDGVQLSVLHIPGHTKGGIALVLDTQDKKILFTGDSLFHTSVGRADLPGGNATELIKAIKNKLLIFPDDSLVLPGHGPSSLIGIEKKENPFLN